MIKNNLKTKKADLPNGAIKYISEESGLSYRTVLRYFNNQSESNQRIQTVLKIKQALDKLTSSLA